MTSQWPVTQWDDSNVQDVFELAQNFELHCAQVYDHAASNPKDVASADYVMQLALQAYRTIHSLHMQKVASSYCDIDVAAAALESKVAEYRKSQQYSPCDQPNLDDCSEDTNTVWDQQTPPIAGSTLEDLIDGQFEDDDESDSDWEDSEEDSDDEYYEYYEGSEADSDLEDIMEADREDSEDEQKEPITTDGPLNLQMPKSEDATKQTLSLPSSSILRDTKMNDSIMAALQNLAIAEPNPSPPMPAETQTEPPSTASTVPSTEADSEAHSETTAVQTQSIHEPSRHSSTTMAGIDAVQSCIQTDRGYEKSLVQTNPERIPRRLKTVCYKYIRKAMVPIRGKVH